MRVLSMLLIGGLLLVLAACDTLSTSSAPLDQQFIDMMVPHHEGALAMASIAEQRAERPEIRQLAAAILSDQQREIDQMKQWRKAWFGSDQTPSMEKMPMVAGMESGHGGHGATMDMAADVERLRNAPEPFDRAFIDAMIEHHQSAIEAATIARAKAARPEIRRLAEQVIAAQQGEIELMRQWRHAWYDGAPGR